MNKWERLRNVAEIIMFQRAAKMMERIGDKFGTEAARGWGGRRGGEGSGGGRGLGWAYFTPNPTLLLPSRRSQPTTHVPAFFIIHISQFSHSKAERKDHSSKFFTQNYSLLEIEIFDEEIGIKNMKKIYIY